MAELDPGTIRVRFAQCAFDLGQQYALSQGASVEDANKYATQYQAATLQNADTMAFQSGDAGVYRQAYEIYSDAKMVQNAATQVGYEKALSLGITGGQALNLARAYGNDVLLKANAAAIQSGDPIGVFQTVAQNFNAALG